ncbi:MAG: DTW domain-containing protein [Deltaproteobacteria bacterium]|nr:DTW domain-containing protein [Deltaproteobacteria bacterium]
MMSRLITEGDRTGILPAMWPGLAPTVTYRSECPRCGRPTVACWCAWLRPFRPRTRVVILQHPRERTKPIGSGRMAHLSLLGSSLHVGVRFDDDPAVARALGDPEAPAVLLYPGPNVPAIETLPRNVPRTLVVVDGTWRTSRTVVRLNRVLQALPRVRLDPTTPSEYRIRSQPQPDFVSTVEALRLSLRALEGDDPRFDGLLEPFRAMIRMQLEFQARAARGDPDVPRYPSRRPRA